MPKRFRFPASPLAALAILVAFVPPALAADAASEARELINSLGCKGCHALEGNGGSLGPALDGVGSRLKKNAIRKKLLDPKAGSPDSLMPSYDHLAPAELEQLIDFLASLR